MIIAGNEWWLIIVWFFPAIILHELGHYVAYRLFGIKPKIKITFWWFFIGEQKDTFKLKPAQFGLIGISGIFTGLIYTIPFGETYLFIYFIMCSLDILNIYFCLKAKNWKKSHGDFLIHMLKKEADNLEKAKWER